MPDLSRMSIPALITRMHNAPDFGYDDEGAELTRRLAPKGKDWMWDRDSSGREVVTIIPAPTEGTAS